MTRRSLAEALRPEASALVAPIATAADPVLAPVAPPAVEDRFPDSMFVPSGIPARGLRRYKYLAIELVVAALFAGVYAMVLTRGGIVGW